MSENVTITIKSPDYGDTDISVPLHVIENGSMILFSSEEHEDFTVVVNQENMYWNHQTDKYEVRVRKNSDTNNGKPEENYGIL